jgi:hypothetical protein
LGRVKLETEKNLPKRRVIVKGIRFPMGRIKERIPQFHSKDGKKSHGSYYMKKHCMRERGRSKTNRGLKQPQYAGN